MLFGIGMLVALYIAYILLVKGLLWKLIFVTVGWGAIYSYLKGIPQFQSCPVNFAEYSFSWAFIAPTILVMLVLVHTKED